jgi:hypothetical protein
MQAEHERAVESWKRQIEQLKAGGAQAKDLPPKPKCPKKPKMVQASSTTGAGATVEEEDEAEESTDDEEMGRRQHS